MCQISRRSAPSARVLSVLGLAGMAALASPDVTAQSPFATRVVAFDTNGNAGGGVFNPSNALGAPSATSTGVHSLGIRGSLTLGFAVTITDGPGDDLIVFENPFASSGKVYSEAMFVEVSTNGVDFARFPTRYLGPNTSGGAFALSQPGWFSGFAGIKTHNAGQPGVDLLDVVKAGGDSFDLADLKSHPLVIANKVDLAKIEQVRLVDVEAGVSKDSAGTTIQDPTAGSADVNAVAVIHHTGNVSGRGPNVELTIPTSGNLELTVSDPDGLGDLNPARFCMSFDGVQFPAFVLVQGMSISRVSPTSVTWVLGGSVPPGLLFQLGVSVTDNAGNRSGQTRTR